MGNNTSEVEDYHDEKLHEELKNITKFKKEQLIELGAKYQKLKEKKTISDGFSTDLFSEVIGNINPKIGAKMYQYMINQVTSMNEEEEKAKQKSFGKSLTSRFAKAVQVRVEPTFKQFVIILNQFHPEQKFEDRAKLCFRLYDEDGGGSVEVDEIRNMISMSLDNSPFMTFSEQQLDRLVQSLMKTFSKDDNEMLLNEFMNMVNRSPGIVDAFSLCLEDMFENEK